MTDVPPESQTDSTETEGAGRRTIDLPLTRAAATSLYGWLWRRLPGGRLLKLLIALLIVAAIVVSLFAWVFPWLEPRLPWVDVTVGDPSAGG